VTNRSSEPILYMKTDEFGGVDFEGQHVPCAFGGEPGNLTAFVLISGVCQIIGIPVEGEIDRIRSNHLLADGLFTISFPTLDEKGKAARKDAPAISLQRLHTWLALIPPEIVTGDAMRQKLVNTQQHFTDVVYAYFGRRMLPAELRAEDAPYIDEKRSKFYEMLEGASRFDDRLSSVEGEISDLRGRVNQLSITISAGEGKDNIDADKQEQLKAMIDILGNRYEQKHGKGTRGEMIKDLKAQHNFRYYNSVSNKSWPALVRDCVYRFNQMNPKKGPLPQVFRIALQSIEQGKLL